MKLKTIAKLTGVMALSAACILGATACSSQEKAQVAATVNGVEILEDTITNDIQAYRTAYSMDDEDTWGEYLSYYGYTPETIRETMINSYVQQEIIKEQAQENGITVDSSEVDEYVNQTKSYYSDDDAWQSALESAGLTEDEYRENIEERLLEQALMDVVCPLTDPSDDDTLTYVKMYASYSYDGAKKSSHILFSADDQETAQKVLDEINAGTISFEDAAKQYSTDTGSATDGGNVGWDCLTTFVDEYQDALDNLSEGEVSGLVTSDYGIHIIKCTEVFNAPEDGVTSLDQVPTEMVDYVKESVKSYNQQSDFSTWLETKQEEADVTINDMPDGLPYYVDMSKYEEDDTNTTNTNTTTTTTTNTNNEATNENANNTTNANNTNGSSN